MYDAQIERVDEGSLDHGGDATDDDEIDILTVERFNDAPEVRDHGLPSPPR
ncbi:hypothetical protein [Sorangium sp. So ce1000]|uniref:hypothetical protein n=1 Tax=Sorangium sp. So ce1000 TaxID=3133325 RepID=UPI003F604292